MSHMLTRNLVFLYDSFAKLDKTPRKTLQYDINKPYNTLAATKPLNLDGFQEIIMV